MAASKPATLVLSVDVDGRIDPGTKNHRLEIDALTALLAERFLAAQVPATWGFTCPDDHPLARSLAARLAVPGSATQEVAVLVDGATTSPGDVRLRGARPVLFCSGAPEVLADALAHAGIEAVRRAPEERTTERRWSLARWVGKRVAAQPGTELRAGRWGGWVATPTVCIPAATLAQVRRAVDGAIATSGCVQLVLDLPRLAAVEGQRLPRVTAVLKHIARRRSEQRLNVVTLGQLVAKRAADGQARPVRSILRPAA